MALKDFKRIAGTHTNCGGQLIDPSLGDGRMTPAECPVCSGRALSFVHPDAVPWAHPSERHHAAIAVRCRECGPVAFMSVSPDGSACAWSIAGLALKQLRADTR